MEGAKSKIIHNSTLNSAQSPKKETNTTDQSSLFSASAQTVNSVGGVNLEKNAHNHFVSDLYKDQFNYWNLSENQSDKDRSSKK
ncbi:MAG: hypothetical protein ACK5Z5_09985 [Neisseriaceae bacterium]